MFCIYICDTPFQVLNCINYIYHNKKKNTNILFLGMQFSGANELVLQLRKTELFEQIYTFKYTIKTGLVHKFKRIFEILFPLNQISNYILDAFDINDLSVDEMYFCVPTHFALMFRWIFPESRLIYLDDGTGSYSGDMITRLLDKQHRLFYSMMGRKIDSWYPECLYVNNVEICKTQITKDIRGLPRIDKNEKKFWSILTDVFSYNIQEIYRDKTVIYLTQMNQYNKSEMEEIDKSLIKILDKYKGMTIVRPHPRGLFNDEKSFCVDKSNCMWELLCGDCIDGKSLLVSRFSTSQFIPKIIYNKEPYIIFLYKIYSDVLYEDDYTRIDELVTIFQNYYHDDNKILIPNTIKEFESCLADFASSQNR